MDVFKLVGSFAIKGVDTAKAQIDSVTSSARAGFSDAERASSSASSGISSHVSKLGGALGTVAKVGIGALAVASTAAMAGVTAIAKGSLEAYASYEQLVGGVETLFRESAPIVEQYAANAFRTAGMSANEYMSTVTSFSASLLQGLGGDTVAAAEYANMAVTDMSDNANKMGTSINMIQDAYQGFAKQNYTMLDNLKLGYGGTQSEMARLINDSGVLGDTMTVTAETVNDVSFDKMIEAIHKVQDGMGITGTTAKEASATIEGSVNAAKAAWTNWLTGIADENANVELLTQQLADSVVTAAGNILPRLGVILSSIGTAIVEFLPGAFDQLMSVISQHGPPLFDQAISLFGMIVRALAEKIPELLAMLPVLLKDLVAKVREHGPEMLDQAGQMFASIGRAVVENGPLILQQLGLLLISLVGMLIERIPDFLAGAAEFVVSMIAGILSVDILEPLGGLISGMAAKVQDGWDQMVSSAQGAWSDICSNVQTATSTMTTLARGAWDMMNGNATSDSQLLVSTVRSAYDHINQATGGRLGEMASTVWSKFQEARSAIEQNMSAARDFVGGIVSTIRGFFDFDISWPYIPLPHISYSLIDVPFLGTIPDPSSLSVDWYARAMGAGMIMDVPTIFGYDPSTGNLMGGGEAGSETVVGTGSLMGMIQAAVDSGRTADMLAAILAAIKAIRSGFVTINVTARDGKTAKMIAQEVYDLANRAKRSPC